MRLQPLVKRKPEDFSRGCTRFYVNSAWVNFSSIPPSDGVSGRHVLQNPQLLDSSYLECAQQLSRDRMAYAELNVRFQKKPIGIAGNSRPRRYFRCQAAR